jgi:hypothetical protein
MLFTPEFRRAQPERTRELTSLFTHHPPPPYSIAAHWWASVYHDTVSRLPQIQAPTLVFHGERDAMSPLANSELLAAQIPDAELAIVPDAGHVYALEQPEVSLRMFTDWIDRREPILAGGARTGLLARAEPLTRPLTLHTGMLRTGASLTRRLAGMR